LPFFPASKGQKRVWEKEKPTPPAKEKSRSSSWGRNKSAEGYKKGERKGDARPTVGGEKRGGKNGEKERIRKGGRAFFFGGKRVHFSTYEKLGGLFKKYRERKEKTVESLLLYHEGSRGKRDGKLWGGKEAKNYWKEGRGFLTQKKKGQKKGWGEGERKAFTPPSSEEERLDYVCGKRGRNEREAKKKGGIFYPGRKEREKKAADLAFFS